MGDGEISKLSMYPVVLTLLFCSYSCRQATFFSLTPRSYGTVGTHHVDTAKKNLPRRNIEMSSQTIWFRAAPHYVHLADEDRTAYRHGYGDDGEVDTSKL